MRNKLTTEQLEKRKRTNKKMLKYGCLPFFGLLALILILSAIFAPEPTEGQKWTKRGYTFHNNINEASSVAIMEQNFDSIEVLLTEYTPDMEKDTSLTTIKANFDLLLENRESYVNEKKKAIAKDGLFSHWDGSNPNLVSLVKKTMNDPGSFEHIETLIWEGQDEDSFFIEMKFRGKNGFGAKIASSVKAVLYYDGTVNILSL